MKAPHVRRCFVAIGLLSLSLGFLAPKAPPTPSRFGASSEEIETLEKGLDLILHRRYEEAMALFQAYGRKNPYAIIAPIGESLIHQARMYEENHFRFTKAYEEARDRALDLLEKRAPVTAWYHFQKASVHGIEGLFKVRQEKWFAALREGLTAINALEKGLERDPEFFDARLGTGIYLYAKSVLGRKSWLIPFSDRRAEGIREIEIAIEKGSLLTDISKVSLALIYLNERKPARGIELIRPLREEYPENVMIRMLLGRIYMESRRYTEAIREFQDLLRIEAGQTRALYYLGRCYLFQRKARDRRKSLDQAQQYLERFLATGPEKKWQAYANYRLGQVEERRGNLDRAIDYWERALELKPDYRAPKLQIERVKKRRKEKKTAQRIPLDHFRKKEP
ncbi:MAG: tetratricopeptide repeat protein [Deltaproteobacteria bacterium]|nr:MAG: tetratricopeptide repeat protein [Deltaproteobacteria bacterium]